jgi:hypothetical protein
MFLLRYSLFVLLVVSNFSTSHANTCTSEKATEVFKEAMRQQSDILEKELNVQTSEKWKARCEYIWNWGPAETNWVNGWTYDYFLGNMTCVSFNARTEYSYESDHVAYIDDQECKLISIKSGHNFNY